MLRIYEVPSDAFEANYAEGEKEEEEEVRQYTRCLTGQTPGH